MHSAFDSSQADLMRLCEVSTHLPCSLRTSQASLPVRQIGLRHCEVSTHLPVQAYVAYVVTLALLC